MCVEDKKTFDNGDEYNGELNIDGQRHGEGVYKHSNGDKYEGSWIQNVENGWGNGLHIMLLLTL